MKNNLPKIDWQKLHDKRDENICKNEKLIKEMTEYRKKQWFVTSV